MKRFRKPAADSLELLLDTICNSFGGIVLIALLITLVTRDARQSLDAKSGAADSRELLERQIDALKKDISADEEFLRNNNAREVPGELLQRFADAKAKLEVTKQANDEAWKSWKKAATKASGEDTEANSAFLEKAELARAISRARTELQSAEEQSARMRERLGALKSEYADLAASRSEQLRLPREHASSASAAYFIVDHNEVFPLFVATPSGSSEPNRKAFDWDEDTSGEHFTVVPRAGRGVTPGSVASDLAATIKRAKDDNEYAAILLGKDSVVAYRALRAALLGAGLEFGWRYKEEGKYFFGTEGTNPPPL